MRIQKNNLVILLLLLPLAGGVANAQSANTFKYIPQALKTAKIPSALNPKLPLQTRVKLGALNPVLDKTVIRAAANAQTSALKVAPVATTAAPIPASCPKRFVNFVRWLDNLPSLDLVAFDQNTQQALARVRHAVTHYDELPDMEKPSVNGLVLHLNKMSPHLRFLPNGNLQRLRYPFPLEPNQLPTPDLFQLQVKQNGLNNPFFHPGKKPFVLSQAFRVALQKDNPKRIRGIIFYPGFPPEKAQEELSQIFKKIIFRGYNIRMGATELGIRGKDLTNFRQGRLHMHVENSYPERRPFSRKVSISIILSAKPYAGAIDKNTRQILISNSDKTIAHNYLILFGPFLNEQGREALQTILEENP